MRLRERFLIWGALWSTVVSFGVAGVLIAVYGLPPETVSRAWWLFALYLAVLLGPLWWALQHWIFRPLHRMNRANRAIREGRWAEALVPPSRIPENEIGELIRSRNDALEHLRREREMLEESRAFQEAILESIPDPLCVLHAERYEILLANPAFRKVYDEPYPEGKSCYQVMHGRARPCHEEGVACPLLAYRERREAPVAGVYTRQHRHGEAGRPCVMEVRLWPMDTPRKRPWVVHVSRDVTQERQRQARALAQERLAAMGMLAAGIAHDFNNLLTPIVGYTELLLREKDLEPEARERALQVMLEQAREAGRLVRQMLDFARSSSTQEPRALPLIPFLKEWVKLLRHSFPERIQIRLILPDAGGVIQADPTQIREALMNLAVNARDAMPGGGVLEIRLERFSHPPEDVEAPADQPWVRLRIRDTGTGIPAHLLPRIFEPFFSTKGSQGTGLGLAQVQGIVRAHGGVIRVQSRVGEGTVFDLWFPEVEETAAIHHLREEIADLPRGHGELVCCVDPDPRVRETLQTLLDLLGYRVRVYKRMSALLRDLTEGHVHPDVVLTECELPDGTWQEVCGRLHHLLPHLPVGVVTANPQPARSRGMSAVLPKPLAVRPLAHFLRHLILRPSSPADTGKSANGGSGDR